MQAFHEICTKIRFTRDGPRVRYGFSCSTKWLTNGACKIHIENCIRWFLSLEIEHGNIAELIYSVECIIFYVGLVTLVRNQTRLILDRFIDYRVPDIETFLKNWANFNLLMFHFLRWTGMKIFPFKRYVVHSARLTRRFTFKKLITYARIP